MKRLKNIEHENQEQLQAIKGKTSLKSQIDLFDEELSSEAVTLLKEIKGHFHYQTITFQNVPSKAQIKKFFIS